jgi:hypothetical protein
MHFSYEYPYFTYDFNVNVILMLKHHVMKTFRILEKRLHALSNLSTRWMQHTVNSTSVETTVMTLPDRRTDGLHGLL